jgi:hypothetical protein
LYVIAVVTAVSAGVGCSNESSDPRSTDAAGDTASTDGPTDSGASDTPTLSADCQRLYDCCVGPADQTASFCTGLVAQNICDVWLQSYAMAGIQCP